MRNGRIMLVQFIVARITDTLPTPPHNSYNNTANTQRKKYFHYVDVNS